MGRNHQRIRRILRAARRAEAEGQLRVAAALRRMARDARPLSFAGPPERAPEAFDDGPKTAGVPGLPRKA